MNESFDEIKNTLTKISRCSAGRYGDATVKYGQTMVAYSKSDADIADVAKSGLNLALSEVQVLIESGFALSEVYYRSIYSLFGMRPLSAKTKTTSS